MKILNLKMSKRIKGSITVFMTFIFVIIFGLILALFENTRIISSAGYIKNAAFTAERALFGDYNRELFEEYGLFGYGGYNGMNYTDMCNDFKDIVEKNIAVKPKNAKLSYTDIYKIKEVDVKVKNWEGLADGDNLHRQIKECLINEAIADMSDKLKNKYSESKECDKVEIYEKLDEGDSYETGKYKEKYDNEYNEGSKETEDELKESNNMYKDVGNPLEVFKELVEDGYLSLVCDSRQLSEEKIEKASLSEDNREAYVPVEKYESAGSFLKDIFLKADELKFEAGVQEGDGKYKLENIVYANKKFSSYIDGGNKAVDYGMEYLICGNENEKENLAGIVKRIIATRMLINFSLISKDKIINSKALATATAIAGVTGIEPVIKGVQYVILAILAFEESCVDTAALLDGRQLPLIKKVSDIKVKYEEICLVSGEIFQDKAKEYKKSDKKITSGYIDYSEYLFCFATIVPAEKIRTRMFDVIQCDLRKRFNKSFRIYDCIVAADYSVTYNMNFIFPFLWNIYGKDLKYKKFKKQVNVSYGYE